MAYELYYWPGLQGRGEFVRLALEDAGADYRDVAREGDRKTGMAAILDILGSETEPCPPFAPPILKDGDILISQAANILLYLGPRLGLAPAGEALRHAAHGLQLTITDMVAEIHNTHHPIASSLYYEDQKASALERSADFTANRLPKFLGYFERVLTRNPQGPMQIVGDAVSYVDLSLFQLAEGLHYAFPNAMRNFAQDYPALSALRETIRARPNIAAYLASPRRIPFNESGIFRHYPELDSSPT